jgi:hypothetical protein
VSDFRTVKRIKTEMAELLSESIREFVTRSLASSLSTSSPSQNSDPVALLQPARPCYEDGPLLHSHQKQSSLYSAQLYKRMTEDRNMDDSMILPSSRHFPKSSLGAGVLSVNYQSTAMSPTTSASSRVAPVHDPQGFPALLGANALTLEPTVSMQQIGASSHWLKRQSTLLEDDTEHC